MAKLIPPTSKFYPIDYIRPPRALQKRFKFVPARMNGPIAGAVMGSINGFQIIAEIAIIYPSIVYIKKGSHLWKGVEL